MVYRFTMPIIFRLARPKGENRLWSGDRRELLKAMGGGVVSIIAYGIVVWAMAHGPMGPVSALRETSTLFAVILGCLFLKEKFTVQKMVSAGLIVAGQYHAAPLLTLRERVNSLYGVSAR